MRRPEVTVREALDVWLGAHLGEVEVPWLHVARAAVRKTKQLCAPVLDRPYTPGLFLLLDRKLAEAGRTHKTRYMYRHALREALRLTHPGLNAPSLRVPDPRYTPLPRVVGRGFPRMLQLRKISARLGWAHSVVLYLRAEGGLTLKQIDLMTWRCWDGRSLRVPGREQPFVVGRRIRLLLNARQGPPGKPLLPCRAETCSLEIGKHARRAKVIFRRRGLTMALRDHYQYRRSKTSSKDPTTRSTTSPPTRSSTRTLPSVPTT